MRSSWLDDLWVALWEALENIWRKLQLFSIGLLHLLFSSDHRWPRLNDANSHRASNQLSYAAAPVKTRTKRIVFVRHAESEWNVVFNRGVWWLAGVRLLRALVREWLLLPTYDSIFIDSPLSDRGLGQATALGESVALAATGAIEAPAPPPTHWLRYLGSALPRSMVVASNLRRTIDTARMGSAARLEATAERIHVLSCLQEVGRNIDTLAISDAYSLPPRTMSAILEREKHREELFNVSESHGNKAILGCARARLLAFANWTFSQDHVDVLVVYGHSHWFRAFCQEFFPPNYDHPVKTEKLANCGVVTFELQECRVDGRTTFGIPPTSFEYIR